MSETKNRAVDAATKELLDTFGARLDTLETRVAYQDETIETLNQTVTSQWQQIEGLRRLVADLSEQLSEAESTTTDLAAEERPPHY